jgi:uncharacterized protein (TIGR03790 family)
MRRLKITKILTALAFLACAGTASLRGAGPGDEVVVVYNTRVPESKAIAEHYAQRRQVPANQIFGFDLPETESMTRAAFRDSLQKPLANALADKKLWRIAPNIVPETAKKPKHVEWRVASSKIRYAVLCYGVPLRIEEDTDLKEPGMENTRPEFRRNEAAVDSELALLPLIEDKLPLGGPLRNPAYGATNAAQLHPTNGVLLVARLDGPAAAIAHALVDKAMEAETNGLWGRAYFDLRGITDPGYKPGDDMIRAASDLCRHIGFETVVDENPATFPAGFPMSQIAIYIGWYANDACGPFAQPKVEFMPGAVAYHLHSFSAMTLRTTNRAWVGPLLAKGVTATMGCVSEPYLSGTPDMSVFSYRMFLSGFSFGEAACASQPVLSWQTTVVGDPLYRPCAKHPEQLLKELAQHQSPWLEWAYLRLADLNLANGRPMGDVVALLERLDLTRQSAVLTEKLGELYSAQGKPASAARAYEEALKLATSPQQRIRLRLALGEKLMALGRETEAADVYKAFLQEWPDYPDPILIFRHLLAIAHQQNNQADAAKYQTEIDRLLPPPPKS